MATRNLGSSVRTQSPRDLAWRLKTLTLALERPDDQTRVVLIQPGDIVTVKDDPSDGDALNDVEWAAVW